MQQIAIDDQVFAHLQSKAIPYVETPNDTLRRLLGVPASTGPKSAAREVLPADGPKVKMGAKKRAKANLGVLIASGVLHNGQKLFLHDYQGKRITGAEASVAGHGIYSEARQRLFSMSDLAQELLKEAGYQSDSVRGPSHWYTAEGKSITNLWDEYLASGSGDQVTARSVRI
jgi:hypothetical protein